MMQRELSPYEQWYTVFAKVGMASICTAFELSASSPRLTLGVLSRALCDVCPLHPLLSHAIRPCPPPRTTLLAWWEPDTPRDPSSLFALVEEDEEGQRGIETLMEREIARKYDPLDATAVRMHVHLVRAAQSRDWMVFTTHHTFFDGRGLVAFASRVLDSLCGCNAPAGAPRRSEGKIPFPPADHELTLRLWDRITGKLPLPEPRWTASGPAGMTVMLPPTSDAPQTEQQRPALVSVRLDESETSSFLAACKRSSVTVSSFLVAAFGRALLSVGGGGGPFVPSVPVDLRLLLPQDELEMRATTCNGFGPLIAEFPLVQGESLWDAAKRFQALFGTGIAGRPQLDNHVANWLYMRQFHETTDCSLWPHSTAISAGVSNMGPLETAGLNSGVRDGERWVVTRALSAAFGGAGWAMIVSTVSGALTATISFSVPMWTRQTGSLMASCIRDSMVGAQ